MEVYWGGVFALDNGFCNVNSAVMEILETKLLQTLTVRFALVKRPLPALCPSKFCI